MILIHSTAVLFIYKKRKQRKSPIIANSYVLGDLKAGHCSSTIQVGLLILGGQKLKHGANLFSHSLQSTPKPATVNVHRLATFRDRLQAGLMFKLSGFDISRRNQKFRLSYLFMTIRLSDSTNLDVLTGPDSPIPEGFWGDPRVAVASIINPKMLRGRLFLNATSGTHVFFDKATDAGAIRFYEHWEHPCSFIAERLSKVEPLTIAELNENVIISEPQDIELVCTGMVTDINMEKDWCYVSCSRCTKKLQRTVSSLRDLQYHVEMSIADDTVEGLFVGFDGEMTKLHNITAYKAGHLMTPNHPPFIAAMVGKTYSFQVRVSRYNFTANHQTFTNERDRMPVPNFVTRDGGDHDGDDMPGAISETSSAVTSLSGRHQETLGIKVFKGGREAT
ncbi:hypothetical protein IGI04_041119 [Brassica rapa subsp. trilocularis]|uniref:Replication factor A C-terminal domain-containing protein n=1 Tax=Brassica rapa subsp. trilocularis TaxID=1813537 RepID=A0ABQ7KPV0_BRACM|nr:hypothetical protein IGI04_041119 [Brassica rapa subsp. trilocularis]